MLLLSPNKHETKFSYYSQNVIFLHSSLYFKNYVLAIVMQQNGCCSNEEHNPEILCAKSSKLGLNFLLHRKYFHISFYYISNKKKKGATISKFKTISIYIYILETYIYRNRLQYLLLYMEVSTYSYSLIFKAILARQFSISKKWQVKFPLHPMGGCNFCEQLLLSGLR